MKKSVLFSLFGFLTSCFATENSISIAVDTYQLDDSFQRWRDKFKHRTRVRLTQFSDDYPLVFQEIKTILYPFGGADILYPLALFTKAETLVLMGLEYPGQLQILKRYPPNLAKAQEDLSTLIKKSFFITNEMSKSLDQGFGTAPVILLQLHLLGVSQVVVSKAPAPLCGLKYQFALDGQDRCLYYLKTNLLNDCLSPDLLTFLRGTPQPQGAVLKATSYSLHKPDFSKIGHFLLQQAITIVQDDSGLPFKELNDFTVRLWGSYKKPYGVEFSGFTQKDLKNEPTEAGQLTFCFGYGCGRQSPVLMVAQRKISFKETGHDTK